MATTDQVLETFAAVTTAPGEYNGTLVSTAGPTRFVPRSSLNRAELETYWAYRAALEINLNKSYFLIPFSLLCNGFCFAVLFKRITKGSSFMLMANLAIWDAASILMKGILMLVFLHAWELGNTGCALVKLLVDICPPIAEWLVVLLTADRVIAVWFPFKYRQLCTIPRTLIAYAFVVVVIFCVCIDHIWVFEGVSFVPYYYCMYRPEYAKQTERFVWAYISFQSYIPTAVMVLLNAALIYRIRREMSSMEKAKNPGGGGKSKKMSTENRVTLMALSISVSFVLLTGPFCGFVAATKLWDYDESIDTYVTYAVTECVVFLLYDLNHCLNLFFYFLSGKKFRDDALELLTCGRRGGKKRHAQMTGGEIKASSMATSGSTVSRSTEASEKSKTT